MEQWRWHSGIPTLQDASKTRVILRHFRDASFRKSTAFSGSNWCIRSSYSCDSWQCWEAKNTKKMAALVDPTGLYSTLVSDLYKQGLNALLDVINLERNGEQLKEGYLSDLLSLLREVLNRYDNASTPPDVVKFMQQGHGFGKDLQAAQRTLIQSRTYGPLPDGRPDGTFILPDGTMLMCNRTIDISSTESNNSKTRKFHQNRVLWTRFCFAIVEMRKPSVGQLC